MFASPNESREISKIKNQKLKLRNAFGVKKNWIPGPVFAILLR
jgi:hypothetical protein